MTSTLAIDRETREWQELKVVQCDAEVRTVTDCDRMPQALEADCEVKVMLTDDKRKGETAEDEND